MSEPECACWPVDNPWTYYGTVEPGGALEPNPECRVHFTDQERQEIHESTERLRRESEDKRLGHNTVEDNPFGF